MNTEYLRLKSNKVHIATSFLMALAVYIILLAVCGITPFGDKTWLAYDMKRQYVDYYAYLRTILTGDCNPFYSFSTTLGSGFIGFFAYYLTSPFLAITLLFPVDMMPLAISIIIGLKLAASAATFDLMLQKLCGRSAYICVMAYAFSGYMIANAMNVMWLDVLLLLPIVIITTEKLLHEGKLLGYTISIALIIYLNYYISYITLIFVALWSVARLWMTKHKSPQEVMLRLGIATGAGVGIDAFIVLPTLLELRNSPKDILDSGLVSRGENIGLREIFAKIYPLSFDTAEVYEGKPLIFCGTVIFILALLYYLNRRISVREKIGMAFLHLILLISFMSDDINLIWHAGMEPSGYPYREAIIFVFVTILCACRSLMELKEGIDLKVRILTVVILVAMSVYVFIAPVYYLTTWKICVDAALLILCTVLIFALASAKGGKVSMGLALFILMIHIAELGCNGAYTYNMESMQAEKAAGFKNKVDGTEQAVQSLKKKDSTFYRIENLNPRQQNDSMMHGYKGVTHYSSAGLTYVRYFLQKMGFNDDSLYTDYGHDNTATADSILGVKYVMTDDPAEYPVHPGYELIRDGDVCVYKNPYALPVAMGVYREMSGETMDPFSLQEDIYGRIVGEPVEIFIPADVQYTENEGASPVMEYRVITEADGELYFYMANLIGMSANLEVYVNGEFLTYYGNYSCLKVLNLGNFKKGDYLMVHVIADDSGEFGSAIFVTEDMKALKDAYDRTVERHAQVTGLSASSLAMTLDSAYTVGDDISGEVGVFTTIPYQKGWKVQVNGVKVEPVEVYDSLMYIPVTEALQQKELGPDEDIRIELRFIPEGFVVGVIVSVLTFAIIILMASIRKGEASFFGDYDEEDDEFSELILPPEESDEENKPNDER